MYWNNKHKEGTQQLSYLRHDANECSAEDDCFAERARGWIYVIAVIVFGVVVLGITRFVSSPANPRVSAQTQTQPAAQAVAFRPCPYCPGTLDDVGRCNIVECPLYSPAVRAPLNSGINSASYDRRESRGAADYSWSRRSGKAELPYYSPAWGQKAVAIPGFNKNTQGSKPVLIKELAMEIASSPGGQGVLVHSVYGRGYAQKAGLKPHDIITRFNGRKIRDVKHFQSVVARAKLESNVKVVFMRNGQRQKSMVMIGEGEVEGVTQPVDWGICPWGGRK